MADPGPEGRDGANRELKNRLKAALARQGLSQADVVRQTQLQGESVSKAAVSNALNPAKGPPAATTLRAFLNAVGISGTEKDKLFRLRDRAESHGPTQLKAYLEAAKKAARQHPYPGVPGASSPPALADVYVRQQARPPVADDQDSPGLDDAAARGNQTGPAVPAAEVFRAGHDVCVLQGGPGGGKSTLLRTHLADTADDWLGGRTGKTLPVMVSAAALSGTDPLPTVLAKTVTGELRQLGLLDELGADFFRQPPRRGLSWLVLVDGVDEIPDTETRHAVLTMLANAAAAGTGLYRIVVATRPLPDNELGALGRHVPRFDLQPFSPDDLLTYATRWFGPLDDSGRHAKKFMAGLKRSRLEDLASTPLMALMLCQLYAADPTRPLPEGRTGAYQSFVELIYEQNFHKNVRDTHDEAIRRLKDRHQIPRDNQSAEKAAQQVRDHLLDLIDHLAHERINGSTAPAVEVLVSHLQVKRPQKVKQHLWSSFLGDLLRPTGILTQRADDFDFLHQTLLEYHAARHATRDEHARSQVLSDLIASPNAAATGRLEPPALDASYLGFLLDGLLAPEDRVTAATIRYVEELTAHGGEGVCQFLTSQVVLRTSLPLRPTTAHLARFASDIALPADARLLAAVACTDLDRKAGGAALLAMTDDKSLDGRSHVRAATVLGRVVDRKAGSARLLRFIRDGDFDSAADNRVLAAQGLAGVDKKAGAAVLLAMADDASLDERSRVRAATILGRVDRKTGIARLLRFIHDGELDFHVDNRVLAAQGLAGVDEKAGAAVLLAMADKSWYDDYSRILAAEALACVNREVGTSILIGLADDTDELEKNRVRAADALARVDREAGTARLTGLADDTGFDVYYRVWAAESLAWVDSEAGAARLIGLADDTKQTERTRVWAAEALARVDREAGTARLIGLARDARERADARFDALWEADLARRRSAHQSE
ncbi:NACHT domain-containing protein [Streptomyces sp. NBC_00724]|uniref:NACHT domain-containing protein n=1 Tax=Streptomyces sp. NBC_00724 TaxID=2975812 RepID=UPI002ED1C161|nr:NACHT domain-containing protein [Streptomyces sp. NBC_00724]